MIGCTVLLLFIFELVSSQLPRPNKPPECLKPPQGVANPDECCKIPEFFSEEDFSACRLKKNELEITQCLKTNCIMNKHNLMHGENKVNIISARAFMDKWADDNPLFKPLMAIAKERCLVDEGPVPNNICHSKKVLSCIISALFFDCPAWVNTKECQVVREHTIKCKPKPNIKKI